MLTSENDQTSLVYLCLQHGPEGIALADLQNELEEESLLEDMPRARMNELLAKADQNRDTLITYREFYQMASIMLRSLLPCSCETL